MRKHCKRKVWALVDPIRHAMTGAAITDTARIDQLRMLELQALDAIRAGTPTTNDWRVMADVVNVATTLAAEGVGAGEVLPRCVRVEAALRAGAARLRAHGHIGRAAGEYEAMVELWGYHDLQRSSISRGVYERAIQRTIGRIKATPESAKVQI